MKVTQLVLGFFSFIIANYQNIKQLYLITTKAVM